MIVYTMNVCIGNQNYPYVYRSRGCFWKAVLAAKNVMANAVWDTSKDAYSWANRQLHPLTYSSLTIYNII